MSYNTDIKNSPEHIKSKICDKRTLIINGSPRKNGDTVSLIKNLITQLNGEYKIVNAYYSDISPCMDCRYCWSNDGCSINDKMTEIYDYIEDCDNIVIASPIYFSQPTGKLLDLCSRFQTYFAAKHFRNQIPTIKTKKGAVILVGGGDGNPQKAYETLCGIFNHINVKDVYELVGSYNTNIIAATNDTQANDNLKALTEFLND
ncbi:MAG: flavodoxin family protein [Clostridia bacterium]|nr:flavodoxin family protein [Clostridia bacterium]